MDCDFNIEKKVCKPYRYTTFGVVCSEVEIDVLTEDNQVLQSDIRFDVGKSLNPAIDIGQIEGALICNGSRNGDVRVYGRRRKWPNDALQSAELRDSKCTKHSEKVECDAYEELQRQDGRVFFKGSNVKRIK